MGRIPAGSGSTGPGSGFVQVLNSPAAIDRLRAAARGAGTLRPVLLRIDGMPHPQSEAFQHRINALVGECGCGAGGIGAAAGLVAYAAYAVSGLGPPAGGLSHLLWGFGICVASSLAAKAIAVLRARIRLIAELTQLRRLLIETQTGTMQWP